MLDEWAYRVQMAQGEYVEKAVVLDHLAEMRDRYLLEGKEWDDEGTIFPGAPSSRPK